MSTEQTPQQSAEAAELRNIVVHQASQLLDAARENNGLRAQNAHAIGANKDLVAEVQRLRAIFAELDAKRAGFAAAATQLVICAETCENNAPIHEAEDNTAQAELSRANAASYRAAAAFLEGQ
jgi:hypothetical protein